MANVEFRVIGRFETINIKSKMAWDNTNEKYVEDNENGKYEIKLLVPKTSPYANKLKEYIDKFNKDNDINIPIGGKFEGRKEFYNCVKDGDDVEQFVKHKDVYSGNYVITAKNQYKPALFNIDGVNINKLERKDPALATNILEDEFYRGVTGLCIISFYTNDKKEGIYGSIKALRIGELTEPLNDTIDELDFTDEELAFFQDPDLM